MRPYIICDERSGEIKKERELELLKEQEAVRNKMEQELLVQKRKREKSREEAERRARIKRETIEQTPLVNSSPGTIATHISKRNKVMMINKITHTHTHKNYEFTFMLFFTCER